MLFWFVLPPQQPLPFSSRLFLVQGLVGEFLCAAPQHTLAQFLNWQADSTAKMIPSGRGACRQRLLLLSHTSPPPVSWSVLHWFTLRIISFLFSRYVQNVNYFHYCLKSSIERPPVSSDNRKTLNSLLFGVQVKENIQTIKQKEQKQHQQQNPREIIFLRSRI